MTPAPDAVGYVDATLRDLAPFPWGTAVGTDDLAAAAAALSEVGARVLEALDARCARAALDARSESPWDRLRAILREANRTPVGVVVGARNLWGDRAAGARRGAALRALRGRLGRLARPRDRPAQRPRGPRPGRPGLRGGRRGVRPHPDRAGPAPAPDDGRWMAEAVALSARSPAPGALRLGRRRPHRPGPARGLVRASRAGHRPPHRGPGAGAGRPRAAVGHRRGARGRRGRAGLGRAGRPGVGPPLGRDAPRRPGRRHAHARLRAGGPRPRRPRGRPDAPRRPPAPGRRRRLRARRRGPAGPRGGARLAPGPPRPVAQPGRRRHRVGCRVPRRGRRHPGLPARLGDPRPGRPARHRGPPLGRDRARAGADRARPRAGACAARSPTPCSRSRAPRTPASPRGATSRSWPRRPRTGSPRRTWCCGRCSPRAPSRSSRAGARSAPRRPAGRASRPSTATCSTRWSTWSRPPSEAEVSVEISGARVTVRRAAAGAGPRGGGGGGGDAAADEDDEDGLVRVTSPMVGTFYRRPAPDQDPFVRGGPARRGGADRSASSRR